MTMTAFAQRYGEWALVTGASSGIGREIAKELAQRGLKVLLHGRNGEALQQVAQEIRLSHGVQAEVIVSDLAQAQGVPLLLEAAGQRDFGLLVNSAGFGSGGSFLDSSAAQELEMVDVNCRALLELTHAFANRFAAKRRGGIILLSSIVAFQGAPRSANYAATKAYVQSLGEALGEELSGLGVDVLCAAPGPTESGFGARAGMKLSNAVSAAEVAKQTVAALGRKRMVVPGSFAKFLYASLMTAPRFLRVKIMKAVMKSMT